MRRQDRHLVIDNIQIYNYYRERLINIALSQFVWKNIPKTMDRWYLERTLLFNGTAAVYRPKVTPDIWLGSDYVQTSGTLDFYGYPTAIAGYGQNTQGQIETDEFKVLFDNNSRTSMLPKIDLYAKLLWEVHNTYRENLKAQRCPYIITCNKNEALSYDNIMNRIDGFDPVVKIRDSASVKENIGVLNLDVKYIGTELLENLTSIWNQALAMLGISGENDKKERMITREAMSNIHQDAVTLSARLLNRLEFCDYMNDKYGYNWNVEEVSQDVRFVPFLPEMNMEDNNNG